MKPITRLCPYCARPFVVLPHHATDKLGRYCSQGCLLAVVLSENPRGVPCHCSLDAMPAGGLERAMSASTGAVNWRTSQASEDSPDGAAVCRRFDLLVWLAGLPVAAREVVIMRAGGARWSAMDFPDAARQAFSRALRRWPELREYFKGRGQRG